MEFHISFAARVRDMCHLGAPEKEIAEMLGVSTHTLAKWRQDYPEFEMAYQLGRTEADAKVAAKLFRRTQGYEYTKTKTKQNADGEIVEEVTETVHVPPDVGACIFWLTNRRPDLWQQRVERTLPNGGNIPLDNVSDIELARRVAFLLAKAAQELMDSNQPRSIEHGHTTDQS